MLRSGALRSYENRTNKQTNARSHSWRVTRKFAGVHDLSVYLQNGSTFVMVQFILGINWKMMDLTCLCQNLFYDLGLKNEKKTTFVLNVPPETQNGVSSTNHPFSASAVIMSLNYNVSCRQARSLPGHPTRIGDLQHNLSPLTYTTSRQGFFSVCASHS